ncbi:tape measure protein [Gilliamella sp. B3022]|uniref:tape measure protein n=3 Tax=Gilliamella TaxID=1193503 RepID=UPI002379BD3F|nr:tape measure protein [Gilliamella sp. B3022]WDM18473.1 tape measure protein [Gilliamella sp. B3022]
MAQYTEGNITYTVSLEMKELLENSRKIMQEMKELNNSGSKASKGLDKLESSAQSAGNSLGKLTNIAKAVSAALVSSTVIAYAQSWNELEDRIQNTGATASQTKDILDQLLVTSDRNGRTIEESAELYIRLSNSMGELGYSTQSTISYIDTLSNLMTINKTNSLSAESATNALTKAQMKGKLAGVEAMTVFNAMPSILKTLGKQLNKTEAEVRKMASDGKLSMSEFTEAMIAAQEETAALADNMRNTVTDGINRVTNNLKKYFGELNNSTGATKLLVDSLILMSQHVDILMTGVGALAAVYAGKYITSLANATKQSAEKVIENIKLATSERNLAKEELRSLEIEGKKLTARRNELVALKAVTTSKIQLAAIEKQLNNIDKQRTVLIDKEALAQTRLASATKLSTLAANGLKGAMSLLGGPAGMLFLAAGALTMWSSKIDEAKQKSLELGDKVDQLREKYKSLNHEQKKLELSRLKVDIDKTKESIDEQTIAVEFLKKEYEQYKRRAKGSLSSIFTSQEGLNEAQNKYLEASDKLKKSQENLAKAEKARSDIESGTIEKTNEATEANKNLSKSWDEASQKEIDKKLASLSKELDIATLKAEDNSEAAFILDGLYSALGDSANEYREDLVALALGQTTFTKLTDAQVIALQPLIAQLRALSAENNKIKASNKKGTTKSYAKEVKELSDKLEVAKLEAQGLTVEAELLAITQKMGSKVTAKQTEELRKLIETSQAYKALGTLQSPIDIEKNSYNNSKTALDDWFSKNPKKYAEYNSKLEQLEQQHQINMAKIKSEAVVSKVDDAVAQVDPVQALKNEKDKKLALIQEFAQQGRMIEENAIALREAANRQYEQNRINAQWEIWRNQSDANEFLASSLEGLASSATSTISGLMSGTMTATQAMQNFANVILNEAIGSLVQMGMQYVKNAIVAKTTSAATTATQVAEAAALTAAYTPAAIQASIATQGAAATIGTTSYMTAMGTMKAAAIAGARKNGGPVDANSMYRVGESGKPEILMQGGKQYLIPGENGQVLSNRQITSGRVGSNVNLTINMPLNIGDNGGMSEQEGQRLAKNMEQAVRAQIMKEQRPGGLLNRR